MIPTFCWTQADTDQVDTYLKRVGCRRSLTKMKQRTINWLARLVITVETQAREIDALRQENRALRERQP